MTKIALPNGQYADLIIAADTNVGGVFPLPNGQYAQTVVPVDASGNVIVAGGGTATSTTFTPAGTIAATNVQAAIAELDSETVKTTGDQSVSGTRTFTGDVIANSFTANLTANTTALNISQAGTRILQFGANGLVTNTVASIGSLTNNSLGMLEMYPSQARIGIYIRGAASQTANLLEARNSSNTSVFSVSSTGVIESTDTTTAANTSSGSLRLPGIGMGNGAIFTSGVGNFGGNVTAPGLVATNAVSISTGTFQTFNTSGTNVASTSIKIQSGQSTGNAAGGAITFLTSDAGTSGTGLNAQTEKGRFSPLGNFLIGTTTDGGDKLQVNGTVKATQFNLSAFHTAPANSAAPGVLGERRNDGTYDYIYTASGWKRSAIYTTF